MGPRNVVMNKMYLDFEDMSEMNSFIKSPFDIWKLRALVFGGGGKDGNFSPQILSFKHVSHPVL